MPIEKPASTPTRWNCAQRQQLPSPEEIEIFLNEIEQACKRHGLSITHEDMHGAFLIEAYSVDAVEHLRGASDARGSHMAQFNNEN